MEENEVRRMIPTNAMLRNRNPQPMPNTSIFGTTPTSYQPASITNAYDDGPSMAEAEEYLNGLNDRPIVDETQLEPKKEVLSQLLESNRILAFETHRSLDEAIKYSKDTTEIINLAKRIVDVNGIQLVTSELSILTDNQSQREKLCEFFGLRKTSHTSNLEDVIYTLVFEE